MNLSRMMFPCLAALVALAGCGKSTSDPVLATVGERRITLASFREAWQGIPSNRPDVSTPEARRKFLDDLVNKDLMELEATRRKPDLDDGQRRRLHRFAETQINNLLMEREVNDKVNVSEADIQEVWQRMDREYKARHILLAGEDKAQQVLADLRAGQDFEQLARERSVDQQTAAAGGDLGWVRAGSMVEVFDKALYRLEAGAVSDVVKSRFGWHIIRADSIRTAARPPIDEVREQVRMILLQERSLARQMAFQEELKNQARPENQLETVQLLDQKFYFELPVEQQSDPYAMLNANRQIPAFTEEELQKVVVKFADRPNLTIRDFNEALSWMPPGIWPTGRGLEEMENVLKQVVRARLYRDHTLKLGLEKDPKYVRTVKKKEGEIRVNSLYYNEILATIQPTEAQRRDFFEKNREGYKILERCQLSRIETADSSVAQLAARTWKSGRDFADIESMVKGLDPAAVAVSASQEIPRGQEPPLDDLVYHSPVGTVVGPVWLEAVSGPQGVTAPRWVVARVLDVKPERLMTYEEAQNYVADHCKTAMADEELKKVLAQARENFPVRVEEKALEQVTPEILEDGLPAASGKSAS